MDASIFIARLLGPVFIIVGLGLILNRDEYRAVAEDVIRSRALLYLFGAIALLGGLAIVLTHNVWVWGWPLIVTLIGWLMVVRGAARILLPQQVGDLGSWLLTTVPQILPLSAIVVIVLGAILSWAGYA